MAATDNSGATSLESAGASAASTAAKTREGWKSHVLTFAVTAAVAWGVGALACIYLTPRLWYNRLESEVVAHGIGGSVAHGVGGRESRGIPINTLYTWPTLAVPTQVNTLESTGNRDTLYTVGFLDLSKGPEVLHVPDMAGRYYSVQFTDPWGTDFAYVGRRTTGTRAGDYLISGPRWSGVPPHGVTQIVSPTNTVLVIGRTLVESNGDLATVYGLAREIQVTPLSKWPEPGQ